MTARKAATVQKLDTPDEAQAEVHKVTEVDVPGMLAALPVEQLNIQDAILKVMEVVGAIGKNELNRTPGASYNFRGVDTVVNAVQPAFLHYGVTISPDLQSLNTQFSVPVGREQKPQCWAQVEMAYILEARDGSTRVWRAPGAAMDSGDKAVGKACSVAYRIAMLQGLCIPTNEPDPDSYSYGEDEGYQTHGRGNDTRQGENKPQASTQTAARPDYTAPVQMDPEQEKRQKIRAYTMGVITELGWTKEHLGQRWNDLHPDVAYFACTDDEVLKSFGASMRAEATEDRAMEEARATQAVIDGLGGTVIDPDNNEPVDAEVVPDAGF